MIWSVHASGIELEMFEKGYPRDFFFRASEGFSANRGMQFEDWEKTFLPLGGIEGKALDEEVPGRSLRNIDSPSLTTASTIPLTSEFPNFVLV